MQIPGLQFTPWVSMSYVAVCADVDFLILGKLFFLCVHFLKSRIVSFRSLLKRVCQLFLKAVDRAI